MRHIQATVDEERALGPKWRQAQAEGAPGVAAYRVLYDGHVPSDGAIILMRQAATAAADRAARREEVSLTLSQTLTLTLTLSLTLTLTLTPALALALTLTRWRGRTWRYAAAAEPPPCPDAAYPAAHRASTSRALAPSGRHGPQPEPMASPNPSPSASPHSLTLPAGCCQRTRQPHAV